MQKNVPLLNRLADDGLRWGVAVSGGGDSLALLHLCLEHGLQPEKLVVLHFNHGWAMVAGEWQVLVEARAAALGVAYVVGRGAGGRPDTNAEAVARNERRQWMLDQCVAQGLAGYLTGHSRTDQVETLLMRLGRGSGLRGLMGMRAVDVVRHAGGGRGLQIIRPLLLSYSRDELRAYLRGRGVEWVEDPGNADSFRGRVRALLPALAEAGIGEEPMLASMLHMGQVEAELNAQMDALWPTLVQEESTQEIVLGIERLKTLSAVMRDRVIGRVVRRIGRQVYEPRTRKRERLLLEICGKPVGKGTLGGCVWRWRDGVLCVNGEGRLNGERTLD